MKNKVLVILLLFITMIIVGCDKENNKMYIQCDDKLIINQTMELHVYYDNNEVALENIEWSLSDYSIANVIDNKLYGKDYGVVNVTAIDITNSTHYCVKKVEIVEPYVQDILITGPNEVMIDKEITLEAEIVPSIINKKITFESGDEDIIEVDRKGNVYAVKEGTADVIVRCEDFEKRYTITVLPKPTTIIMTGNTEINIGETSILAFNIEDDIELISDNEEIVKGYDNMIVGISTGTAIITAISLEDSNVKGTITITVKNENNDYSITNEEQEKINSLINSMTIEQKVGEMFNVGIYGIKSNWGPQLNIEESTGLPYAQFGYENSKESFVDFISSYNIGNFTVYDISGESKENLTTATKTLKQLGKNNTGINPFITIESTGGNIMDALVTMPSNQAMAIANSSVIDKINDLYAQELNALGINSVLNCYLNNNTNNNSSLNLYGEDIYKAMVTASTVEKAYKQNNVVMISDLSIYNQYYTASSIEQLKTLDYSLLESIVQNGSQMISIPIYQTYLKNNEVNYYSLVSKEFIQDYLCKQLNYQGIVMLDDAALTTISNDVDFESRVVNAINAGVDMLSFDINFTRTGYWIWDGNDYYRDDNYYRNEAYKMLGLYGTILNAVKEGTITEQRINEAVSKILVVKIRNNILEDTTVDSNLTKIEQEINSYKGNFVKTVGDVVIKDNEKVLIISESNSNTGTTNSLGDCLKKKLGDNITVNHIKTLRCETVLNDIGKYDRIYIAVSNIYNEVGVTIDTTPYIDFINQIKGKNPNICIIATGNSDVIEEIGNINNYILLYDCYEDDFLTLSEIMLGK